ncbi:MAG: class C sortase [Oscillospiraceae bacterium]|nr:class C sortase [Oscillospiraceae bacterium]
MRQWTIRILAVLVLLVGVGLVGYPVFNNYLYEKGQERLSNYYASLVREVPVDTLAEHLEECRNYNALLAAESSVMSDPFSNDLDPNTLPYRDLLNFDGRGTMGSIEIPGITDRLMIYHGTKEDVLQQGVGHLQGTSLPIGGAATHCVLSAHCGLPSKKLFTNLDQLELGDVFYLHVAGDTLAYQVDQINIVLPHETEYIRIEPEGDYVTLVTCTPYGINSHRLLVRGTHIPYEEAEKLVATQQKKKSTWMQQYIRAILIGLGIAAVIWLIIIISRRLRRKNQM